MRTYDKTTNQLITAVCNCCGKPLSINNGMLMEGICSIDNSWGYFSNKDMEHHSFDLCENCYDKIISKFAIKPSITEESATI